MKIVLQMKKTSRFHSSIQTSFNLSIHLLIHPPTSPRCFTLNISPPRWVQVLSITSTQTCTYSTCTHTHTHTHTHKLWSTGASSDPNRRKGDGGSEISQQRGAERVRLCERPAVGARLLVSWCCLVPAGRRLWCYDFSVFLKNNGN